MNRPPILTRFPRAFFVFLVLLALLIAGCDSTGDDDDDPIPTPNFQLEDLNGNIFRLSDQQGKVVMLHFFAPWCTICQSEAPIINQLFNEYEDKGVVVVGIAIEYESLAQVEEFKQVYQVPFPILPDVAQNAGITVGEAYGVLSVPTTYFIDKQGRIDGRLRGAFPKANLAEVLDKLIAE